MGRRCFVFDERVGVGHGLEEGEYKLCRACRFPLKAEDTTSPLFEEGVSCPHCYNERTEEDRERFRQRQLQMKLAKKRGEKHLARRAETALRRQLISAFGAPLTPPPLTLGGPLPHGARMSADAAFCPRRREKMPAGR